MTSIQSCLVLLLFWNVVVVQVIAFARIRIKSEPRALERQVTSPEESRRQAEKEIVIRYPRDANHLWVEDRISWVSDEWYSASNK